MGLTIGCSMNLLEKGCFQMVISRRQLCFVRVPRLVSLHVNISCNSCFERIHNICHVDLFGVCIALFTVFRPCCNVTNLSFSGLQKSQKRKLKIDCRMQFKKSFQCSVMYALYVLLLV